MLQALVGLCDNLKVADIRLKGLVGIDEKVVRDVIPFKVGDPFRFEDLDLGVSFLRKWGVFDVIEARTIDTTEGVVVEITFGEAKVITSIDIIGNYPYLENKILKYLTIHTGDLYTSKRVEDQIDRIKEFYNREGYVDTEVYVEEEEQPFEHGVAITFRIGRGDLIRYRTITIEGNRAYPDGRFASAIDSFRPYSEQRLRRTLRELAEFYRQHGYPRAKIWIIKKEISFDARRADLVVGVYEGPKVKVKFKGNHRISNRKLRKAVTIFKEGNYDSYEIEASIEAIKQLYKTSGYPEAQIKADTQTDEEGTIAITFTISEGASQIVRKIIFEGNDHIGAGQLKKDMATKQHSFSHKGAFDPEMVDEDASSIRRIYSGDGYGETEVGNWDVKRHKGGFNLDITIPIQEGLQTIVRRVVFKGNDSVSSRRLLSVLKVRPKKPLDEVDILNERQRLLIYYTDHGHPYAEVKQTIERDEPSNAADIIYDINEGDKVQIGRILIVGDVLTSQKAIKGSMGIHEGDKFSYKKIVDSQLNLRRLGAFSAVTIETIGLAEKEQIVHLLVEVDEQKPFLLDLEFGYSTDYGFSGALSFTNLNSFGWAKRTMLKMTGGRDLQRAEIGWLDPAFLGSSFEMSVLSWIQHEIRPAFDYLQLAGSLGFFRRYRSFGFFFKYELDRNYLIEGSSTAADAESLRDNTISDISLSSSYDTRDSFSNPTKGWFTMGGVDIFNEIGGNQANFVKFYWQGENEETIFKRFTFSTMLRFNNIVTIGSNVSVPTNELLFLGGDDTVRGFDEDGLGPVDANGDPTGGRVRWIFNEELRIRLFNRFQWVFFFDMGSLTNNFSGMNWDYIRQSAGFGLRYVTPVGPIRADYGIKLDRKSGESFGRFHLTFGYLF